ncbi:glycosyltransferase family 4 protein [Spongisporangium articulatum]|uniref:Glycosyltransferase family 4 protein n=1 Tax=Spongisporangium articulatum TaxID=3362603 RepID=A0ABW8ANA0_9ACTN
MSEFGIEPTVVPSDPLVETPLDVVDTPAGRASTFTVLHVVRSLASGTATAIADYAAALPDARHVVLCDTENSFQITQSFPVQVLARMPQSFRGAVGVIRDVVAGLRPDVIHAHSSFAGFYVRAGLRGGTLRRVVYTPHCYSFFRRDVGPLTRSAFWLAEAALTLRTPTVAACSPDEARAAARLPRARPTYVPNVAAVPATLREQARTTPRTGGGEARRPLVVSMGRLCPQKDPALFVDAAVASREAGLDLDWLWIGGADDENRHYEELFRKHGVGYTGWVSRSAALSQLARADLYVHTAAWEGAPLSVLESAALGVPVLGRTTPALRSLGLAPLWRTPQELVRLLQDGLEGAGVREAARHTEALLATHTREAQRQALAGVYADIRSRVGAPERARRSA